MIRFWGISTLSRSFVDDKLTYHQQKNEEPIKARVLFKLIIQRHIIQIQSDHIRTHPQNHTPLQLAKTWHK